jgi:hypothetical protein
VELLDPSKSRGRATASESSKKQCICESTFQKNPNSTSPPRTRAEPEVAAFDGAARAVNDVAIRQHGERIATTGQT